ncbi:hypothetical protein ACFYYB_33640 [Streptomyces sp. NPDC002886]|uniref:hypothetical protein n=1 Tax=Streptomyces sp. NPDC002886 TaxID=3364667 RepID=UPI0036737F14
MSSDAPPPPEILRDPEVLHEADGICIWHTGLVRGPVGLVLTLVVDAPEGLIEGAEWEALDPLGPAGMTLRGPDSPGFLVPFQDMEREVRRYRATGRFGEVRVDEAWLQFWVRPLGLQLISFIGEAPTGRKLPFVVEPEVLYRGQGRVAWHPGVVRGPSGLFASLEVRAEGGAEAELLGIGWELGNRSENAQLPLRITAESGGSLLETSTTVLGGEQALWAYSWFAPEHSPGLRLHYEVPPLGVHVVHDTHGNR